MGGGKGKERKIGRWSVRGEEREEEGGKGRRDDKRVEEAEEKASERDGQEMDGGSPKRLAGQ